MTDDSLKLVTDVHVRSEHDRHLFAEAMLELLGAPDGVLVAVQRLTLRAVSVLGSDGRASRVQRSHDLLQVVVEHSSIAHSVVREANGDAPLGAVYDRVPERLARFDSEWPGRGRVSVRFRVVLAGDEARLFPPDSSVVLRAERRGRALEAIVTSLPEAMLSSMSPAVAHAAGQLLVRQLQHWWAHQGPRRAHTPRA